MTVACIQADWVEIQGFTIIFHAGKEIVSVFNLNNILGFKKEK